MTTVEERLTKLENHALWLAHASENQKLSTAKRNWYVAFAFLFVLTLGLFSWLTAINGIHDHFLTFGFQDDGDFITVYDKPIDNVETYVLALFLGIIVSTAEKVIIEPGKTIIHGLLIDKNLSFYDGVTIFFYEAIAVILGTVTTFLYFTNVAILLCVFVGKLAGSMIIYVWLYPAKEDIFNVRTAKINKLKF